MSKDLKDYICSIPDFPEPGVLFRDITSLIQDADGFRLAIQELEALLQDVEFDVLAGAESRGFIFAAPLAYQMHKPLVLVRKAGKLPRETVSETYDLEYGTATVEMHTDALKSGSRVVLIDDLIATGGTLKAACSLVEKLGGSVERIIALMELTPLGGREALKNYDVASVIKYS